MNDIMTPEAAIITLNNLLSAERIQIDKGELRQAVLRAKAALQKQIPCAPNKVRTISKIGGAAFICNNCEYEVYDLDTYCTTCGQRLDWEPLA